MQSFIRGQRAKISQLSARTRRFEVLLAFSCARIPVFDFVCFGVDAQGQLSDDRYMVFFNQRESPDKSLILDELRDQEACFSVDLDALPPHIERLVFTVSPDGAGRMSDLSVSSVTLREASANPLACYRFSGPDFGDEGSLLLAEIYQKGGEWRFGTIGQGFAGNLSALLKHFGGSESEEAAPSASPTPQISPTPAQIPAPSTTTPLPPTTPPVTSNSANAPLPTSISAAPDALQKVLDGAPDGATIQLPRGEYRGPISLSRPITIEGAGAVIWAQNGPVLSVQSNGVTLRGVQIEVTDADDHLLNGDVALWVEGAAPTLENVGVRGRVLGIGDAGEWHLPLELDLGTLAPRAQNSWIFVLQTPVACRLKSSISGVQLSPERIEAGQSEVRIVANGIAAETFLAGQIEVESGGIVRAIPLCGRVGGPSAPAIENRHLTIADKASESAVDSAQAAL